MLFWGSLIAVGYGNWAGNRVAFWAGMGGLGVCAAAVLVIVARALYVMVAFPLEVRRKWSTMRAVERWGSAGIAVIFVVGFVTIVSSVVALCVLWTG